MAAKRNDKVRGRTRTLVVSIRTRKGLSQSGAPSGSKWAVVFFGLYENLDIISLNHTGSPKDKVKIKCLDVLKVYGINPIKFTMTNSRKIDDSAVESPFKLVLDVRDSWVKMVSLIGDLNLLEREFVAQNEDWIRIRMAVLVSKKMEFDGNKVLNENGSKDEKMSVIMARLENLIENFEGF